MVGMPSIRTPLPPGLGISTFRTALGTYVPLDNSPRIACHRLWIKDSSSSTVTPSIPGAPLLRTTR